MTLNEEGFRPQKQLDNNLILNRYHCDIGAWLLSINCLANSAKLVSVQHVVKIFGKYVAI